MRTCYLCDSDTQSILISRSKFRQRNDAIRLQDIAFAYARWDYGLLYVLVFCLVAGTKVPRHESWLLLMPPLMTGLRDYVLRVCF